MFTFKMRSMNENGETEWTRQEKNETLEGLIEEMMNRYGDLDLLIRDDSDTQTFDIDVYKAEDDNEEIGFIEFE